MIDLIICNIPSVELRGPPMGPAVLKSYLESKGFTVRCLDLNLDLFKRIGDKSYFSSQNIDIFIRDDTYDLFIKKFGKIIEEWAKQIISLNARWVGLSLHCYRTERVAIELCKAIKTKNPEQKVVVGGPYTHRTGIRLYKEKLIDEYILGEGEYVLEKLLKNETIDPTVRHINVDLSKLPRPDYSDFDFFSYPKDPYNNQNQELGAHSIYIETSRGCVRKCTFCNIVGSTGLYKFKTAEQVVDEFLDLYNNYGIEHFAFADNALNGNQQRFKEIVEGLCYYTTVKNYTWKWSAHYIIRNKHFKTSPPELFEKMHLSGCNLLKIGVESGSSKIREEMGKKFENNDVFYVLEQCLSNNIKVRLLLLVGYVTESESDFLETLDLLTEIKTKGLDKAVAIIGTSIPLAIVENTSLWHDPRIKKDTRFPKEKISHFWIYKDNDIVTRIMRYQQLRKHSIELGFKSEDPFSSYIRYFKSKYNHLFLDCTD